MNKMNFYAMIYFQNFKNTWAKQTKQAAKPPVPPSSDKDKEDYKEEFEPNPDYGKDFFR